MTSIRDIPYEDIKIFLKDNNKTFKNKDDAYNIAIDLFTDKKSIGHTISIIEWMMAFNLLKNKINIPHYNIYEIDNMSQYEINQLAKLLTMKGNNRDNIKNILRYLHKLDEKMLILPDISNLVFSKLNELEIQDINITKLKYNDIINLLKTHRNKKLIRKFIFDNLEKIIFYNIYFVDFNDPYILDFLLNHVNIYNKNTLIDIINDAQLKKYYSDKEINDVIKEAEENDRAQEEVYIDKDDMYNLVDFTFNLIDINEIELARKTFNIINKFHLFENAHAHPYNYDLINQAIHKNDTNILKTIIDFMGENEFILYFDQFYSSLVEYAISNHNFLKNLIKIEKYNLLVKILRFFIKSGYDILSIQNLLENLVKIKKYDLLVKILQIYIKYDHDGKKKIITKILQNIQKAIIDKNDDLIIKYIKYSNL